MSMHIAILLLPVMSCNVMFAPHQKETGLAAIQQGTYRPKFSGRSVITEVLGGELKFEFFHRWFNSLFLASVALTLLLLYGYACDLQHLCAAVLPCCRWFMATMGQRFHVHHRAALIHSLCLVLRRKYQHSLDEGPPDLPLYAAHHTKA